ncbi:hypothetical protein C2845_PM01G09840 [Panicum miliaceum]|uniref:Uncharacterized protein n=1 Tax=Panicum miliaceum TaxID=4540 RepID=A0A3L6TQ99_PANMI|nr:hypothetical protein C2845_PM01G09840 [Panicum miliaceum]
MEESGPCLQIAYQITVQEDCLRACKTLSSYKGELPVPPEVRKACATLITYGTEAVKSNEVLNWTCGTLEDEEEEWTLKMLHPFTSPRIKRWKLLRQSKLHYLVRKFDCEEDISPIIPAVTGIKTTEGVLDSVCVLPYNLLLHPKSSKARDRSSFPLDQDADMAGGDHTISVCTRMANECEACSPQIS